MAVKIYFPSFLYGATGAQNIYDSTFSGEHTPIDSQGNKIYKHKSRIFIRLLSDVGNI